MAETRLRGRAGYDKDDPFKVTVHTDRLNNPLHWRKPAKVFVCSMGDLFHPDVRTDWIFQIASTFILCPRHTFMILTKRPERMKEIADYLQEHQGSAFGDNVWLGVSVEDQETANERIPILLQTPAALHFVSYEPALGPVDFTDIERNGWHTNAFDGAGGLRWIIAGCETGPGARPADPTWFQSVRAQCGEAHVPFFMKKLHPKVLTGMLDGRKIEEFPTVLTAEEWAMHKATLGIST